MTLFALILAAGCGRDLPAGDPARPDILVVSIDTLRADHLGAWGYPRPTSPFLDELAAGGTRFSNAWSPSPWTLPSHATMLSGLLPLHHGAIESDLTVPADVPWLPVAMRDAGYATSAIVATLFVGDRYGFNRGFDAFEDFGIDDERANRKSTVDAEDVVKHARRWAASQPPGKPLFLFLHFYDVHYEYDPPAPFNERFDRPSNSDDLTYRKYDWYKDHPVAPDQLAHQVAQYDEEIAYVDATLATLRDAWKAAGREAIWVVTADHGEEFGERGSWGHAHTLWPEQLHVPWIVAGPGVKAQVRDERVGLEDLAPTVAGLAKLPWAATDGTDRGGVLRGEPATGPVAARLADTSRFDTLLYRWHAPPYDLVVDLRTGERTLCDLTVDPGCTTDLAPSAPDTASALAAQLDTWLGAPWRASADGVIRTDGAIGTGRPTRSTPVAAGDRIAVHPLDAEVRFTHGGTTEGPYKAIGGDRPPEGAGISYQGEVGAPGTADLDDALRERLEALGYVH
jgi:arylsulfatase A-like enzyme